MLDILRKIYETWQRTLFFYLLNFSEENKVDDSQHDEKDSKNDQNANMEVESSVKDENASESNKVKENEDVEGKDVEETTDDNKPGMYLKYFT